MLCGRALSEAFAILVVGRPCAAAHVPVRVLIPPPPRASAQVIDLANNGMGSGSLCGQVATALADVLSGNDVLVHASIAHNGFGPAQCGVLRDAAAGNHTLRGLHVGGARPCEWMCCCFLLLVCCVRAFGGRAVAHTLRMRVPSVCWLCCVWSPADARSPRPRAPRRQRHARRRVGVHPPHRGARRGCPRRRPQRR